MSDIFSNTKNTARDKSKYLKFPKVFNNKSKLMNCIIEFINMYERKMII